ncbi:MAG: AI-2E family transporter [Pirellulaceae bacterium]|nr:AI-2E family transporter [Pirellulaceae bacterium]
MPKPKSDLATLAAVAQLLAVVATVAALFFAKDVLIPLALGLLLSFLLSPVVNRLQRFGIPNVLAVVMTALIAFLLLGGLFTLLGREMSNLVGELPNYKSELVEKARGFAGATGGVSESLDELAEEVTEAMEEGSEEEPEPTAGIGGTFQQWTDRLLPAASSTKERPHDGTSAKTPIYVQQVPGELPLATWATTAGTVFGPLATAGLVTVFALFILIHREDLRDRIIAVISHGDYVTTTEAMDEAAERISRYLVAQTIINTGYGITLAIGLASIGAVMTPDGFPNAIMWGVLASCLRFVPYLGPTAAAVFPSVIALSVFPGYSVFLAVVALITTMELVCNNIVEPWLYGTSTGISAVAVIFAAVFWGWLWGPVGLLLSTPLTVCLVVLGRYVPRFGILSTLFGEDVEIRTSTRVYQRLLAADEFRAWDILEDHFDENGSLDKTTDEVLIPALKRIRRDHDAEHLSDADAIRLFALAGGLIAKLREHAAVELDDQNAASLPTIVGCASHHFSETLVLNLLRSTGQTQFQLDSIDDEALPSESALQISESKPACVVIVILPKGGFAQARFLCKSIRDAGYAGPIVIACFGKFKNFDRLFVKFRKVGATNVTTSFSQTHQKIQSILNRRDAVGRIPYKRSQPAQLSPIVT